jgi:hypothetical protein
MSRLLFACLLSVATLTLSIAAIQHAEAGWYGRGYYRGYYGGWGGYRPYYGYYRRYYRPYGYYRPYYVGGYYRPAYYGDGCYVRRVRVFNEWG